MSSFLMWSNLVFPLSHLNILISAELSLFSSFFFMAQHWELYGIAGLMIVLKTLSFNSTGIFLSHITPDTSRIPFLPLHPPDLRILLLTSACEPPSLVNSDPRYLKDVTVGSSAYNHYICNNSNHFSPEAEYCLQPNRERRADNVCNPGIIIDNDLACTSPASQ